MISGRRCALTLNVMHLALTLSMWMPSRALHALAEHRGFGQQALSLPPPCSGWADSR